ncbi:ribosome recycling factor [Mycoplasmopsis californica]|uniref:Ribosome recycling factor n=1 Tax=Mycoplasmopsis equigenitalium TaxID=114883 RepID=A0ABY5J3P7_9BACT|nr:ribosome recycling factor [Mycoplasmopsis equigenitalium]UUD36772.1 ribosome recycling factor [Mycoplasmopsis equigenitalium]VEU69930.1 ribosome recycling factor [Mycoplasmopsis californica]
MNEFEDYLLFFLEEADAAIEHYEYNLSRISAGRANPQLIKNIKVNYYDTPTPIEELASITSPEPQQLLIKPYDISCVKELTNALTNSGLSLNCVNEGNQVRITFPTLTGDRRRELVKQLAKFTEQARVGVRNGRHNAIKQLKADELSEDIEKRYLDLLQKHVDKYNDKIAQLTDEKTKELTTL